MLIYAIKSAKFENYVLEVDDNMKLNDTNFIKVGKIFQLLDTKNKERYLVKLFDKDDSNTFLLGEVNGEYYFSLSGVTDLMVLKKMPDIKVVTREIYINLVNNYNSNQENILLEN